MYSNYRSVQILISLLKEYDIRDIVLSPGGSDIPLIHSIETDDYFKCYSVVDERSAAYFALGIANEKNHPVACICTSGSAVCNYLPGITEAFYQSAPVLAITADKNPYFQGQLETQKIDQNIVFGGVVKKSVELPIVNTKEDEWLCNRLVNEALLSLTHHGRGPAHINLPVVGTYNIYDCETLPKERRIFINDLSSDWKEKAEALAKAKRILVVVGQNVYLSKKAEELLSEFFSKFNCVYAIEHLSNLECEGAVNTYPITETLGAEELEKRTPEIVISLGNNLAAYKMKPWLRKHYKTVTNWLVSESGEIRDAYKCLTDIFECSVETFFKRMVELAPEDATNLKEYYNSWKESEAKVKPLDPDFSNFYVAKKLSKVIPENALLHCAILNSTRLMQFFPLNRGVKVYSNVGTLGIDGCFSTFAGAAAVTDRPAFFLTGDLSFFYDMNAAGLRSIDKNVRVILLNNGGGSEFHFFVGRENISTLDSYICAEHSKTAKGWIESLGYKYFSASTAEEFDSVIDIFSQESSEPLFLEVFTKMEEDAQKTKKYYKGNIVPGSKSTVKSAIKKVLPEKQILKIKKIVDVIKG